jgi:hypothetical protein
VNDLREDLDRALRAVTFSEAPVERARRDGRRIRVRRRLTLLAGALAVAAAAAGYPALAGSAAAPSAGPGPAPSPAHSDLAVNAHPGSDATEAPGGLASKSGEIGAGSVGAMQWKVYVVPPGPKNPVRADSCYAVSINVGSDITGNCNDIPAQLGRVLGARQPAAFLVASDDNTNATVVGEASADVTYFIVTFTDGQQLKLLPVTAGGHRYVAWMAPLSMTIGSVTAHLGGPYSDSGQTASAVPFQQLGAPPLFGLWQREGDTAPPRDARVITSGRTPKVTAYEGPWGTCFITAQSGGCVPVARLAATTVIDFAGANPPDVGFGAAAPGVAAVRVTLSDGKAVTVHPVGVGNEDLFAFPLSPGATAVSWAAYDAAGHPDGAGPAGPGTSLAPGRS